MKSISIVLPIHNEEGNLPDLFSRLKKALKTITLKAQIIAVDDCSTDNSLEVIKRGLATFPCDVKIIRLRKNSGQSLAINAGISNADSDLVLTMDSDGQHDPMYIPKFIEEIKKGNDIVCGWRMNRHESDSFFLKHVPSKISNFLIKLLIGIDVKEATGGMRLFTREVAQQLVIYENMNRFVPIIAAWKGFKVGQAPILINKREHGKTHYSIFRLYGGFLDLLSLKFLVSFSKKPLHFFGGLFLIFSIPAVFILSVLAYLNVAHGVSVLNHLFLFFSSFFLLVMSLMFFSFGIVADMISLGKIYEFHQPALMKRPLRKKRNGFAEE